MSYLEQKGIDQNQEVFKAPELISSIIFPDSQWPSQIEVTASGMAYVTTGQRRLYAVKIQKTQSPEILPNYLDLSGYTSASFVDMVIDGNDLFLLTFNNVIFKINIKDPGDMTFVTAFGDTDMQGTTSMAIAGSYLIVSAADDDSTPTISRIFILDRDTMLQAAPYYESATLGFIHNIEAFGLHLYCHTQTYSTNLVYVEIIEIESIFDLQELGKLHISFSVNAWRGFRIQNETAYITTDNQIAFVNLVDKQNPSLINIYVPATAAFDDLAVWGDYITLLQRDRDLIQTINGRDFNNPYNIGTSGTNLNTPIKVKMYGDLPVVISTASRNITVWNCGSYRFPAIEAGALRVQGDIKTNDDVEIGKDCKIHGSVTGGRAYFKEMVSETTAGSYIYAWKEPLTSISVPTQASVWTHFDFGPLFGEIIKKDFEMELEGGTVLGPRYEDAEPTIFNVDMILDGYSNASPDFNYYFAIGKGNANRMSITNISSNGSVMTVTTANPHGLNTSDYAIIMQTTSGLLNESGQVTATPTSTTFTLNSLKTGTDTTGIWGVKLLFSVHESLGGLRRQEIYLIEMLRMEYKDFIFPLILGDGNPFFGESVFHRVYKIPN